MTFEGPPRKGILKTSNTEYISTCSTVVTLIFMLFGRPSMKSESGTNSNILGSAWDAAMTIEYSLLLYLTFYQVWKRENILKFLNLIQQTDEEVKLLEYL